MKKLLLATATLAIVAATPAFATTPVQVILDNFSVNQGPFTVDLADGSALPGAMSGTVAIGGGVNRSLTLTPLSASGDINMDARVRSGQLQVINGVLDDSRVVVEWSLPSSFNIPTGATGVSFFLDITGSDGNPATAGLFAALSLGSQNIPINVGASGPAAPYTLTFSLGNVIPTGNALRLTLDGQPGWDVSVDRIGYTFTPPPPQVAEPATLALMGAGLLGLGLMRRRRAA
jgi:hypothetical protein